MVRRRVMMSRKPLTLSASRIGLTLFIIAACPPPAVVMSKANTRRESMEGFVFSATERTRERTSRKVRYLRRYSMVSKRIHLSLPEDLFGDMAIERLVPFTTRFD